MKGRNTHGLYTSPSTGAKSFHRPKCPTLSIPSHDVAGTYSASWASPSPSLTRASSSLTSNWLLACCCWWSPSCCSSTTLPLPNFCSRTPFPPYGSLRPGGLSVPHSLRRTRSVNGSVLLLAWRDWDCTARMLVRGRVVWRHVEHTYRLRGPRMASVSVFNSRAGGRILVVVGNWVEVGRRVGDVKVGGCHVISTVNIYSRRKRETKKEIEFYIQSNTELGKKRVQRQ